MDDDFAGPVLFFFGLVIIVIIVYVIFLIASALAAIAGASGVLWGGGTAVLNYGRSFKENMIDSNH